MRNDYVHATPTKDEYIGTVYGTAALATVTETVMLDAFDSLEDNTSYPRRRDIRLSMNMARFGMEDVRNAVNKVFIDKSGVMWVADFGNAAYEAVSEQCTRLTYAIANQLGRCREVEDTRAVAMTIVAQCLAHESADYTDRRAAMFRGCTIENRHGSTVSVPNLLRGMSCRRVDMALKRISMGILQPILPDGFDLLSDMAVSSGCKAIMETLGSVDTWAKARDKADRLNSVNKE